MSSSGSARTVVSWRRLVAAGFLFVVVFWSGGASGQERPRRQVDVVVTDELDVRVVNLEVVVTDSSGKRVRGLVADDFELRVDGRGVPIRFFTEVAGGRVRATDPPPAPSRAEAPLAPGSTLGAWYLVYIDNVFSLAPHRNAVLRSLALEARDLRPADRMAIVTFDGARLELVADWTHDVQLLADALAQAQVAETGGLHRITELQGLDSMRAQIRDLAASIEERLPGGARALEEFLLNRVGPAETTYAELLVARLRASALAAASAMRGMLPSEEGRKILMLLSGGWPSSPEEFVISDGLQGMDLAVQAALASAMRVWGNGLEPLVDTANQLSYTIYPVDVPGAWSPGAADNVSSPFVPSRRSATSVVVPRARRETFLHHTLEDLARGTAGRALLNQQRLSALSLVHADVQDFYWIGFVRDELPDDAQHEVEVQLARPGLKARHRPELRDISKSTEASVAMDAAMLFRDEIETRGLVVRLGTPSRSGRRRVTVPFEASVPLDQVVLLPSEEGRFVGSLNVRVAAQDATGRRRDTEAETVPVVLDGPAEDGASFVYRSTLELRHRDHRIVLSVQDPLGGAVLVGAATLRLDEP